MNIVVCIKQVPDTTNVKIDKKTNTLIRQGVKCIINPYDLHALEAALTLKEQLGGKVTVISMGPPQVEEALKETISLGVDEVLLLSDRAFAGADTLATSYTLSKGIEKLGKVDLIICGKQAIDGDTAQVGPGIAEHLNLAHTTNVDEIKELNDDTITVKRKLELGYEIIEMKLPALITVIKEINEPRLPSISGIIRSREIEVPVWTVNDLELNPEAIGLDGSPTWVVSIDSPEIEGKGEIFTGQADEQVENLLEALKAKKIF